MFTWEAKGNTHDNFTHQEQWIDLVKSWVALQRGDLPKANNRVEEKLERQQLNMNSLVFRKDVQMQTIEQILKNAETKLGEICTILASYTRKTAKLRDKVDLLVATLFDFSCTEDPEFQIGFKNLAEDLAMVQDYRHAQVERLETKVVSPLKAYGEIVKNKRIDLKKLSGDLNRGEKEIQRLEKIRQRNPADRQSIAEVNAQKASSNAQRSIRQIEETIKDFQRQKLEDVKKVFREFITVEMLFHAKALEVFSHTYRNMEAINAEKDLELFSGRIRMLDSQSWLLDRPVSSHLSPLSNHFSSLPQASWKGQTPSSMEASNTGQGHRQQQQHNQHDEKAKKSQSNLQRHGGMEEELKQEEEEEESETEIEQDEHIRQSYAVQYAQTHRKL